MISSLALFSVRFQSDDAASMAAKGLRQAVVAGDFNNISLILSRIANRQTDSEINRLPIQENNKQQNLRVYTDGSVTKDQSGWGCTVKQSATTTPENGGL